MGVLSLPFEWRVTVGGVEHVFASPATPGSITLVQIGRQIFTLADVTTAILYRPGGTSTPHLGVPSAFDFLYCLSTKDIFLELTTLDGSANERCYAVPVAANVPFVLGSDSSFYNYTAGPAGDAFAGQADNITQVRARNISGATATIDFAVGKST